GERRGDRVTVRDVEVRPVLLGERRLEERVPTDEREQGAPALANAQLLTDQDPLEEARLLGPIAGLDLELLARCEQGVAARREGARRGIAVEELDARERQPADTLEHDDARDLERAGDRRAVHEHREGRDVLLSLRRDDSRLSHGLPSRAAGSA